MIINVGQAWESCSNQLVIPVPGIYFLSFSSASVASTRHNLQLHLNETIVARSFIYGNTFNGSDVSSSIKMKVMNLLLVYQLYTMCKVFTMM